MLRKKWVALAGVSVAAMSVVAWAATTTYQLQTKLNTAGGTLQVRNKAVQSTVGSVSYANFTTSAAVPVMVKANPGYVISSITKSGKAVAFNNTTTTVCFYKSGGTVQSLIAGFTTRKQTVTASVTAGGAAGTVSPTSSTVNYGASATFTARPAFTNGYVSAIKYSDGTSVAGVTLPAPGSVSFTLPSVTSDKAVAVTFNAASVNLGQNKVVVLNSPVTLTANVPSGDLTSIAWSVNGAAAQTGGNTFLFTPSTAGTYTIAVTSKIGDQLLASSTVQVSAVASLTEAMNAQCNGCHNPAGTVAPSNAYANWAASVYPAKGVSCVSCHTDSAMPTAINTANVEKVTFNGGTYCVTCHTTSTAATFMTSRHWTTAENSDTTDHGSGPCMEKCHFKSTNEPGCATCHSGKLNAADGSFTAGGDPAHKPFLATGQNTCFVCHSGSKHGGPTTAFQLSAHWTNSTNSDTSVQHGVAGYCMNNCHFKPDPASGNLKVACSACHDSHKPESIVAATICQSCHNGSHHDATTTQPNHVGVADCTVCHDPHKLTTGLPHSNYTSSLTNPNYRASYVTPRTVCTDCHFPAGQTDTLKAVREEWAESAHGSTSGPAWMNSGSHDWKNSDQCVRCHTAVGFVAYSSLKVASKLNATDKECEPLTCNACHTDVTTGALRSWSYGVNMAASNGATISYDVPGSSSLCVRCHGGRESGDSIKLSTGDFSNLSFINSHYLAAAGVVYTKSGYEYAGQTYDTLGYHKNVGNNDAFATGTAGPCVACHMSAGTGHTWEFLTKDGSGHITANNSTICVNCHDGLTGAVLEADKEEFQAALAALKTALAAKGIFYDSLSYPYFFKDANANGVLDAAEKVSANAFKNWDGVYPGKGKDVMGAAFNLNLLTREPGAWAHNKQYALKLIVDSCDFLADGVVDGAGIPAAVITAQNSMAFADATGHPAPIVAEGTSTNCAACHVPAPHYGGTAFLEAQYVSATSKPIACTDCHGDPVKTTANQAILAQFAGSAHGDPDGEAWRHYDWRSGNRSSCARCHTGTAFAAKLGNENDSTNVFLAGDILKPGESLTCSACHSDAGTGALRAADHQFTISMRNGATATYDVAGASTLCARCHSGRETGESIKADTDTTGVRAFVDSHYQPVAGTLYNKGGYEYPGQNYDLGSHKLLGATSQGPCVTCHMPGKNHTFVAAGCGTCHGVTAPVVDAANLKAGYDAALNDLKLALEGKGIYYGPVHPYFYTAPYAAGSPNTPFTNWGSVYGAERWKDTMGAAFNYNMLWSEKGAYAHNYDYAMKLIADSIDFLSDGSVDGR